jgi:hypothetical protein
LSEQRRADNARCPRCGGAFHCGADEKTCACALVTLDAAARAAIALRFAGCLCNACLVQLGQQAAASIGGAS